MAGIIDDSNKEEVISAVKGKSRKEVDLYLASFRPRKQLRESIKPIVVSRRDITPEPATHKSSAKVSVSKEEGPQITFAIESDSNLLNIKNDVSEKRYQLSFSISAPVQEKLEEAKSLLSSKYPKGVKLEYVLAEALEVLLEKRSPERRAMGRAKRLAKKEASKVHPGQKPEQKAPAQKAKRHIPQALKDQVYQRDKGRCAFVASDGKRCNATYDLEIHHIKPFARNGRHSLENLELRCRCHNIHQAKIDFGKAFMSKFGVKQPLLRYGVS